jgi:hypothetical protein
MQYLEYSINRPNPNAFDRVKEWDAPDYNLRVTDSRLWWGMVK